MILRENQVKYGLATRIVRGSLPQYQLRRIQSGARCDDKVTTPNKAYRVFKPLYEGQLQESMMVLMLNTARAPIGVFEAAVGTHNLVYITPREIFQTVLHCGAAAIIIAHNHPSGDLTPSADDYEVTNRLTDAGKMLGIEVLDSMVIADHEFYSFAQQRKEFR